MKISDYIGKAEALRIINEWNNDNADVKDLIFRFVYHPGTMPPERTAHWKPYLDERLLVVCSECGSRFDRPWEYCPHCGAKMEEEE